MTIETLAGALEREHHEIDTGIERFLDPDIHTPDRSDSLSRAILALRRHIYLEEAFLFPSLREVGLAAPVFVMLREHGEIWTTLDEIEARLAAAEEASASAAACRDLLAQLAAHNFKEEAVIYPQADAALDQEQDAELRRFLTDGRLPDGWVCERAVR